jgi:two-component system OmpR family sensor kinase
LVSRPDKDVEGLGDERVVIQIRDSQGKEIYRSVPTAPFPLQQSALLNTDANEMVEDLINPHYAQIS